MTRFKELARIQAAISHRNVEELRWALGYCKIRPSIASSKEHIKHWTQIEKQVIQAMNDPC